MKNKIIVHDIGYLEIINNKNEIVEIFKHVEPVISDYDKAIDLIINLNKVDISKDVLIIALNIELNDKPMIFDKYPECCSRLRHIYANIALICGIENMVYFDNLTPTVKTYILNKLLHLYNKEKSISVKQYYVKDLCLYIDKYFKNSSSLKSNLEPMTIFNTSVEFITLYVILKNMYDEIDIIRILKVIYTNIIKGSKQLQTTFYLSVDSKYIDTVTSSLRYYNYLLFNKKYK